MGEISCAYHLKTLEPGPIIQMLRNQLFAGGNGKMGVNVKISDKSHVVLLNFLVRNSKPGKNLYSTFRPSIQPKGNLAIEFRDLNDGMGFYY
jgi:hypothetical protein